MTRRAEGVASATRLVVESLKPVQENEVVGGEELCFLLRGGGVLPQS